MLNRVRPWGTSSWPRRRSDPPEALLAATHGSTPRLRRGAALASADGVPSLGTVLAVPGEREGDGSGGGLAGAPTTTAPRILDAGPARRSLRLRRLFLAALVVFLGLGAFDVLGVRTRQVSATGGGYELTVRYAAVSRPGLATPLSFEIRRPGGFDGPVRVAVTADYLDLFDENGLSPDPVSATSDGQRSVWEFEPPEDSDTLDVSFDVRLEPGVQLTAPRANTAVLEGGVPVVSVGYRTWVMP